MGLLTEVKDCKTYWLGVCTYREYGFIIRGKRLQDVLVGGLPALKVDTACGIKMVEMVSQKVTCHQLNVEVMVQKCVQNIVVV